MVLPPNEISYSAAISACEKGKQWEEALRLLQQTTCRALTPDKISYSAAISACEKGKQWVEALRLLLEMTCMVLTPNESLRRVAAFAAWFVLQMCVLGLKFWIKALIMICSILFMTMH